MSAPQNVKLMKFYRHGDLLLKRMNIPRGAKNTNDLILAHGESGHRHRLVGGAQILEYENNKYVKVQGSAQLVHEEHKPIDLEAGEYVLIHEREFEPFLSQIRQVRD